MRAFIVRPFGIRNGIDFERVDAELVSPVLDALGITGRTTQEIASAGNIRTDMFERLLLADIVIADISIHNANVYYELGIRHALRDRVTVLMRARADEVPFDLRTDRYLEYDAGQPATAGELLRRAIEQSRAARRADSPVFLLLPHLTPTDPERFRPVPEGFTEEVRTANRHGDLAMLAVLADEAAEAEWRLAGLRVVGKAQFELRAWPDARATWEEIRRERPLDAEANLRLGTVLQQLGDIGASSDAVEGLLDRGALAQADRAEAWALLGSNAKQHWLADWQAEEHLQARAAAALRSPCLEQARKAYDNGFLCDQNHWYSGINALAMSTVTLGLADRCPEIWAERFEEPEEAASALAALRRARDALVGAVRRSIEAHRFRERPADVWFDLTEADLALLTARSDTVVARKYREARSKLEARDGRGAVQQRFPAESAARQIRLYRRLGVLERNAAAALVALEVDEVAPPPSAVAPRARTIVFSGHRIDPPGRHEPRFPPTAERQAAELVRSALQAELDLARDAPVDGIAGGASGGDILFHELCAELGIPTSLLLALPPDRFAAASVQDAGPEWVERFRTLGRRLDIKTLADSEALPDWLAAREDYSIWQRNNRWILHTALSRADTDVTLVVLWNGKGGDGPGGTQDMVELARGRGIKVVHLDASPLAAAAVDG